MERDINETKKKRKFSDATSENPVKKKKSKSHETIDTTSTIENEILETSSVVSQEQPRSNGKKKEKRKKKRKVNDTTDNVMFVKNPKINGDAAPSSKITQNGTATSSNDPDNPRGDDDSDNENAENTKVSNKEASKLSGKSLRKSFNSKEGLQALGKFLTICKENKQRDLAAEYLQAGGSVLEILRLLDTSDKKNINNASTVFAAMHLIIMKILSEYPQYQSTAEEACRHFINSHLSFVHSMLSSQSNAKHRKIVLRLLASMVSLGGNLPRELLGHLSFHSQVLDTLSQQTKPTDSQSVRTCFVHFVLAFLVEGNASVIRAMLDKRGMLSCIFPELAYDSHTTVHLVLNTVKTYVLENQAISKTSKLHVFSTPVLQSLVSLYNWKGPKNWPGPKGKKRDTSKDIVSREEKEIAVEAVHDFLITLLTSNRHGVIFHDRSLGTSGHKNNQLVNTVLQSLDRPWEHPRPLDLVIRILVACPDLVRSQLTYTEPFLEPRVSKKWILAMRFVGILQDSLDPENCLKPCLSELTGSQLINAVLNLTIPLVVLKSAIVCSLNNDHTLIRNEGVVLLTKMLKKATDFTKIVENNCDAADFVVFKHSMIDYISKNVPGLESILKVWNLALVPEENMKILPNQEEIVEFIPQRHIHFAAILDLLEAYREICPEQLNLTESGDFQLNILLTGLNELTEIEPNDLDRMKVKALQFLLAVDIDAFAPNGSLFGQTLSFLISLLDQSENETESQSRRTIKMLLTNSEMFDGCNEQIDFWINSFACLDLKVDKIKVASWFVNIVQKSISNTDKYLDLIFEAEELTGERVCCDELLNKIFHELCDDDSENRESRPVKMAPWTSISPVLCCALHHLEKNPDDILAKYLSNVTILTLHCQVTPGTLIYLTRNIDVLPTKKYLKSWLTEETPTSIKKSFLVTSVVSKLSKILLTNETIEIDEIFDGDRTVEFEYHGKKIKFLHDLGMYEVTILLRMTIFYLTQFMQREQLTQDKFDVYKLCTIALLHIAKDLNNGDCDFVEKCSRTIFMNPSILQYFSPFFKTKNIIETIVTRGLIDICKTVVELNDNAALTELFLPFKNKFILHLSQIVKKCQNGRTVKNSSLPIEFMEILRPTTEDIIDILQMIVNLPNKHFMTDKTSLSVWGNFVPKLLELLTMRKSNDSEDLTIDTMLVRQIVSQMLQLKFHRQIPLDLWESNLQKFLAIYPRNIVGIRGHAIISLLKSRKTFTTTDLLCFLISRNVRYIPLFVTFVSDDTKMSEQIHLVLSILSSNLTHDWHPEFLKKVYKHCKDDVITYFGDPTTKANWVSEKVKATVFLIDSCFESEDCEKACGNILSNGDKLDNVDISYVRLLGSLFKRSSSLDKDSEVPLTQLVQVLIRITVSALKRDSKNEEKLETLCQSLCETINLLRSRRNDFIFEDLSKNDYWPQFTRFSLKLGMKTSKNDEKRMSLLKTLVSVCDVAYKDGSENEYVKTLFEMTTSHSEFINLILSSRSTKRDLLELLWILVRKNHSTMSSSQLPLYLAAYNATLQESDQFIVLILQHYETNEIKFNEYRPYLWGEAAATYYSVKGEADTALWRQASTSQVLDLFNPEMIKETVRKFPVQRELKPVRLCKADKVYDPSFYLPLLSHLLSENNVVACHKVTQSGALALAFAATGSCSSEIRLAAYTVITRFYFHMEATSSKEKKLWIRFVDAFRNGIMNMSSSSLKDVRTSCLVSTFLARASLVMTQPINRLYSPLQAFFMAKESMELNTVPEWLRLFNSSDIEHKAHRHWILEVIRDGMRTNFDTDIALKCVIFKMIMSFYTCCLADPITKILILQIIESTMKIPKVGIFLARRYGFFIWLSRISEDLNPRELETIDIVISIIRETLKSVISTSDGEKSLRYLLLVVLTRLRSSLSKNTSVTSYAAYTSALCEIIHVKRWSVALSREDLEGIVKLGREIFGDVGDVMDALRYGGECSSRVEKPSAMDDELTIGRASLRKLVLIWCTNTAK